MPGGRRANRLGKNRFEGADVDEYVRGRDQIKAGGRLAAQKIDDIAFDELSIAIARASLVQHPR